jgi:hypothetical protein
MGFFDRFKKSDQHRKGAQPAVPGDVPLTFQSADGLEIACCRWEYALKQLDQLRDEGRSGGFTVILLGGKDDADGLAENRKASKTSAEDYLRLTASVDVRQWLSQQIEADPEKYQAESGDWPSEVPDAGHISAHLEGFSKKPKQNVYLAKIPTPQNWQVPAYIGMGGWNDCPDPAVLTAFSKHWHERYGAEVVSITRDVIEFTVARPPTTKEAAVGLAREQYTLCPDIVDQGVGDVSTLAATLLGSKYWFFWWD